MAKLELDAKRPLPAGEAGYMQGFMLNGRDHVLVVARHQAAEASAPHRKPAVWWVGSVVAIEPRFGTVWKGRVYSGESLSSILRRAHIIRACDCCGTTEESALMFGSLVCEDCVNDAAPIENETAEMAVTV